MLILIIRTPKRVPLILGNPHVRAQDCTLNWSTRPECSYCQKPCARDPGAGDSLCGIEVAAWGLICVAGSRTIRRILRQSNIQTINNCPTPADSQTIRQSELYRQSEALKSGIIFVGPCGTSLSYLQNPATETLSDCLPFTSDCLPFVTVFRV